MRMISEVNSRGGLAGGEDVSIKVVFSKSF